MFEGEFEQVESEIMTTIFEIAEGEQKVNLKKQWADFKEAIVNQGIELVKDNDMLCQKCKQENLSYLKEHECFHCNNCGSRYVLVDDSGE